MVLDLRDPCFVYPWDVTLLKESFLYYKRELFYWPARSLGPASVYQGKRNLDGCAHKLRPLSYGIDPKRMVNSVRPFAERDIDVFMSGMSQPLREKVAGQLEAFRARHGNRYNIEVHRTAVSHDHYWDALSRSKLVTCVESFGCETWRMYEASAAGAVPLLSWPYTQNVFPFEPDRHAIYFSYIGDHLERQILSALENPKQLAVMSEATASFTRQFKDRRAIGSWIIENSLQEFSFKAAMQPAKPLASC